LSLGIERTQRDVGRALAAWSRDLGRPRVERLGFGPDGLDPEALRASAGEASLAFWERRHGLGLPRGLRAWLALSDGFYPSGRPAIHPVEAIGPMVPFARVPGLVIQPESWFEFGNPEDGETLCLDLAYRWPGGDCPVFASGDDRDGRPARILAPSFEAWFERFVAEGGRPFWLDRAFPTLGDPWVEHRRRTPRPPLPGRLRRLAHRVAQRPLEDWTERAIAAACGVSRQDAELLLRHLQHAAP